MVQEGTRKVGDRDPEVLVGEDRDTGVVTIMQGGCPMIVPDLTGVAAAIPAQDHPAPLIRDHAHDHSHQVDPLDVQAGVDSEPLHL